MRVTIVVPDNRVIIDGEGYRVDCSSLVDRDIHALQWYDDHGELEFVTKRIDQVATRKGNVNVHDFAPYQHLLDQWAVERDKYQAEVTKLLEEQASAK